MEAFKRTLTLLMIVALGAFGAAVAQDDQQTQQPETQTRTVEIQGEDVAPLGEIQVGESQAYDQSETTTVQVEMETGAIVFTADSPGDQHPNVDLVGPNGYYERFEVDDSDGQFVVDGLLPGVYSIAASDDGLQLAHTLVDVAPGQAASVNITLQALEAYQEGTFQPTAETAYPDNAFQAGEPQTIENADFGEVTVETDNDNARFVVTGPNNYSQEFTGTFTASNLPPGVYVIAGTVEGDFQAERLTGAQIATTAVAVNVAQRVTFVPVYDIEAAGTEEVEAETEEVEDVAGGGEAQQTETETEVETETETEVETEETDTEQQDGQQDDQQQQDTDQTEGQTEGQQTEGEVDVDVEVEGEDVDVDTTEDTEQNQDQNQN